jgi:hypothetical protein
MKYLIALTLLISLASCKKCAECTTTVTTDVTGQTPVTSKSETQMCGDELKENDGYYNTATSKTTCR